MIFPSNAHTHTPYCDGISTIEEMIDAAEKNEFVTLGFSGHANQGFDSEYSMMDGRQQQYFEAIEEAKKTTNIKLYKGLEVELTALPDCIEEAISQAEYILGALHYCEVNINGACIAYDGDPVLLGEYVDRVYHGDGMGLATQYYDAYAEGNMELKPTILAHFDLIRKYANQLSLFDENDLAYQRLASDALAKMPLSSVLEINTGGMARGYLPSPYPTDALLSQWLEMGGEVTLTSDCHNAKWLTFAFSEMIEKIRRIGYKRILYLGKGESLFDAYDLK